MVGAWMPAAWDTPRVVTAPMADFTDVAGVLTDLTGRVVERVVVDDQEWRASAVAAGTPEGVADFTLGMFRAARRGEFAVTDPILETTLGRPATSVRTVLQSLVSGR
jgi:NAD(P)H dehydrogenase (quinone)